MGRLSVLVEGWRGINHSYALVNQYQLLELLGDEGLALGHRDLPFARRAWSGAANPAGFTREQQAAIDALRDPSDAVPDRVYRIASPFAAPAPGDGRRTLTFMITEVGLSYEHFVERERVDPAAFTRDGNLVQTASAWSADRIADWGVAREGIRVVPLGVDAGCFRPLTPAERQLCRATLGVGDGEVLFFSVTAPFWNKGLDVLLRAFATLRRRHGRGVRLLVKDQRDVYGRSADEVLAGLAAAEPGLVDADVAGAISFAHDNVPRELLRLMYCAADAYVSSYRAEGFNLPVLEAIACGTPVIVTAGGATDGFCDDALAVRVPGAPGTRDDPATRLVGRFVEPDVDGFVEAMDAVARGGARPPCAEARAAVLSRFSWPAAGRQVAALLKTP